MEMMERHVLAVADPSQVGEARRMGCDLARSVGFDEMETGRVALAVTEAAANIVKHGGGGHMLFRADDTGVGFIALDRGPGMPNVPHAMRDGFSTAGTTGTGLGAIARQASDFDIYAMPGHGTAAGRALLAAAGGRAMAPCGSAGVSVPKRGETVCGDSWAVVETAARVLLLVSDGLGHGPLAAAASARAVEVLRARAADPSRGDRRADARCAAAHPGCGRGRRRARSPRRCRALRRGGKHRRLDRGRWARPQHGLASRHARPRRP
jgi:anti-sigma regulatory factor (Ser/Thr protein kinase)